MKPIRVLVVGMTETVGGIENFLMAYCRHIDKKRVQFDFLSRFSPIAYQEEAREVGQLYHVCRRSKNAARYYEEIHEFFRLHAKEYDVIWDNECMFNDMTPLKLAQSHGIPVRIAHCHNPQNMDVSAKGRAQELLHRIQRRSISRYANVLWACSEDSAKWACPNEDLPVTIVPNAIEAAAFRFDPAARQAVREQYGLTDCLVVGHVGRLQYQKNQDFLLEAFAKLHQREPRCRLVIAGDGPDLTELEARAVALDIDSAVLFLGVRDDIPRLMQGFDLFAMPSRFEGLGMAAIEAQAAGLPCVLSDAVPRAAKLTDAVTFLKTNDADRWAECMLDILQTPLNRRDQTAVIARAGYDIATAADVLASRFETLMDKGAYQRRFLMTVTSGEQGVPAMNKARQDIEKIAVEEGYVPFRMKAGDSARGNFWKQMELIPLVLSDWIRAFWTMRAGDLLVMQYPYFPLKGAGAARLALHLLQWKGVQTAAIVHDLDSLRRIGGAAAQWSDQVLLPAYDRLVVHNDRMARYLVSQGVKKPIISLGLFDYLTQAPQNARSKAKSVCIAGNLRSKKSSYLAKIRRIPLEWHLYGPGWTGKKSKNVILHGQFTPESLPGRLEGAFGVIWDGGATERCTGHYGAYLMLNNPHKMSLYLASGMPVIVWSRSAMAEMVKKERCGLIVDSLTEIPERIAGLTQEDYAALAENARRLGEKVRAGAFTRAALRALESRTKPS